MREKIKDPGRISHMLDAARLLADEIPIHTLESIQENKKLFRLIFLLRFRQLCEQIRLHEEGAMRAS